MIYPSKLDYSLAVLLVGSALYMVALLARFAHWIAFGRFVPLFRAAASLQYEVNRQQRAIKSLIELLDYGNRRKVRMAYAGGSHTNLEWEVLKRRYDYTCPCCLKREPEIELSPDHVVPVVPGGSDDITNIQPLCRLCNTLKGGTYADYRPGGRRD